MRCFTQCLEANNERPAKETLVLLAGVTIAVVTCGTAATEEHP
jgi:hypothetical protein